MKRTISFIIVLVFALAQVSYAGSFKIVGTRPLSMGGAHVAVAEDAIAQYWNPAGFAMQSGMDIQVPFALGMETTRGIIKEVDDLAALSSEASNIKLDLQTGVNAQQMTQFMAILGELDDLNQEGLGLIIDFNAGAAVRVGKIGVSVMNSIDIGADPYVDLDNLGFGNLTTGALDAIAIDINGDGPGDSSLTSSQQAIAQDVSSVISAIPGITLPGGWTSLDIAEELVSAGIDSGLSEDDILDLSSQLAEISAVSDAAGLTSGADNSFSNNTSNIALSGLSLTELIVTYARSVWKENFYVGANIKLMRGDVGYYQQDVFAEEELQSALFSEFNTNHKSSSAIGVDAGVIYDMRATWKTKFGMVIRNLNEPTFEQPASAKAEGLADIDVSPQIRVGVATYPLNFITLAADLDITKNSTALEGFNSQLLGLGAELNILNKPAFNIALRAGMINNLAESDVGSVLTAGLGLNIMHFMMDLGGAISTKTTQVAGGDSYPTSAKGSLTLSLNF